LFDLENEGLNEGSAVRSALCQEADALPSFHQVPLAALGAPAVGIIAEFFFGYSIDDLTPGTEPMPPAEAAANARALSNGIFVVIAVPFVVCAAIYSLLYRTYPRDRARALQAQEVAMVRDPSFVVLENNVSEVGDSDAHTEMDDIPGRAGKGAKRAETEEETLLGGDERRGSKRAEFLERTRLRLDTVV
jgi:hypothetical protein